MVLQLVLQIYKFWYVSVHDNNLCTCEKRIIKRLKPFSEWEIIFERVFCVIEKIYMKGGDGDVKGKIIWHQKGTSLVFKENAARLPVAGKKYWDGQVFL